MISLSAVFGFLLANVINALVARYRPDIAVKTWHAQLPKSWISLDLKEYVIAFRPATSRMPWTVLTICGDCDAIHESKAEVTPIDPPGVAVEDKAKEI